MISLELPINNGKLIFETGYMAKQSDGAVIAKYGDTLLLATVVSEKSSKEGLDFFPLTIDYQEKAFAAGKIPGGFLKREGRPSEKEILTSRLIDRPMRPLFPDNFYCETQGIVSVLSYGEENVSDVLGIIALSAALMISDIPFDGPVGAVRVGRLDGNFIINPNVTEMESLDLNLVVAGTEEAVTMVEGGSLEVSEEAIIAAIEYAHGYIKELVRFQKQFKEAAGKQKRLITETAIDETLFATVKEFVFERMKAAVIIADKLVRQKALDNLLEEMLGALCPDCEDKKKKNISEYFFKIEKDLVRGMIINEGRRADGRGPDEIRHIESKVSILPRAHGSALFVRGETQALVAVTLGTSSDEQKVDSLDGDTYKSFMLHYNFPPFSVGEVRPLRTPGRREIGHGALAERSLKAIIPSADVFPYTIRVVSDILESNGSSSMATVCGSTLALMDAGVPIKSPVAGIAMGLIKEGDKTVILTDILGVEDHLGDMDFKVAGTADGITAFQMDVKIKGVTQDVLVYALEKARIGRLFILNKIKETIEKPRTELSPNAPRIYQMKIKEEKIKDVIGTGGKVIKGIIEQTGVKIDIDDSGMVTIASIDEESLLKAREIVSAIVAEPEVGQIYNGTVRKIMDFGAFVEILPGTDGLLHISQISKERIKKVTDVLSEGDKVVVKVLEIDKAGKIKLSAKEAQKDMGKKDQ
ncbi:MAG: polyribonucleotide nucleotidyltransferase [Candidatus Magnetoovum sp. WYHC-5]|nr:polyribonucleotide nucleotidyltransferase [Candidatus Magnetoovum sp. WYHC-5]